MDPAQAVAARLLSGRSGTVLDAGAGSGELSALLKDKFTVTSCDIFPEAFRAAPIRLCYDEWQASAMSFHLL